MIADEFDIQLQTYLEGYQGATPLPDFVREAVRAQVRTLKQVRPSAGLATYRSLFQRLPAGARIAAIAAGAAALALGLSMLGRLNVANPPSPTPLPQTPAALTPGMSTGDLDPGSYVVDHTFAVPLALDLPAGWYLNFLEQGKVELVKRHTGSSYVPMWEKRTLYSVHDDAVIGVYVVTDVYRDPCHPTEGFISPAPIRTVDQLTNALVHQPGIRAGRVLETTVDDLPAKSFDLRAPASAFEAGCDRFAYLFQWTHTGADTVTGEIGAVDDGMMMVGYDLTDLAPAPQHVTVVDVDGTVVLIEEVTLPQATSDDVAEMHDIVASIRIE